MTILEVKKSIARSVAQHTISAAFSTVNCYAPPGVTTELKADLHELEQLDSSPLVDAAKTMVEVAITHSIKPTEATHATARAATDTLADLMIRTKEIKG